MGEGRRGNRRRLSLRTTLLLAVAVSAALLSSIVYATGALNGLERKTIDARFGIRGAEPPGSRVAIVAVDQKSLRAIDERLPIRRILYAQLLDRLKADRPALIAMDVQFLGRTDPHDDNALLAAVARDGPVLLATHDSPASGTLPVPAGVVSARGAILASAAIDTDPDGVLRRMIYAPVKLRTLAVRAAEVLQHHAVDPNLMPDNHAWIDFRGPPGTFRPYSFVDVLTGRYPRGTFTGKAVLVGITDPAENDLFVTAASSTPMAGVEVQANALTTILNGFPLQSTGTALTVILLILFAALPALLSLRLAALYVLAGAVALLIAFLIVCQLAFDAGSIVPITDPIVALVLGTAGAISADSFVQRRQLRKLQEFFELLPSPVSDFFISYRRGPDSFVANTLRKGLADKFGPRSVFLDTDEIAAGEQFPTRIENAIAACRAMLVVIGPDWLNVTRDEGSRRLDEPDDWVRREIELGLARHDIAIVPVLYGGATMPRPEQLPETIRELALHNDVVLTGNDHQAEIDALVRSMENGRLSDFLQTSHAITVPA